MDTLYTQLKQFGHVRANASLSKCTTFRIGGPAQFLVEVAETDKLAALLNFLREEGVDRMIIGGGSNLLFSDDGFEGVVIKVTSCKLLVTGSVIEADAGVWLGSVLNTAVKNSLTGLEWAAGVPGTVGGAVRGNAGAMGKDTAGAVKNVEVWREGERLTLSKDECNFSYRESGIKNSGDVILRVWFELAPGEQQKIMSEVQGYVKQRLGKFPPFPSAGSFFKNVKLDKWKNAPENLPAIYRERGTVPVGFLVEQVGLKGFSAGGAKVSDEHGNFIVNVKNATQSDVLQVVEKVKEAVYNKFGVELEEEVEIVR